MESFKCVCCGSEGNGDNVCDECYGIGLKFGFTRCERCAEVQVRYFEILDSGKFCLDCVSVEVFENIRQKPFK